MHIKEKIQEIKKNLPPEVKIVAATKNRSVEEIIEAIDAGIEIIGENYIQEAEKKYTVIGKRVKWHVIGHLQKNKVKKAIEIFDMIETLDSFDLAKEIDKWAKKKGIVFPVLIEINSGKEPQKSGVFPEETKNLIKEVSTLENIKVEGLMTMGPIVENPEEIRPYFQLTKKIFDECKEISLPNVSMKYLSMGMSDTWKVAVEEGANLIRIGTYIFGPR